MLSPFVVGLTPAGWQDAALREKKQDAKKGCTLLEPKEPRDAFVETMPLITSLQT
jgi:hypothetical protein